MVVSNEDGSYTILINARLSMEERVKAYEHAMKHIREDDFSKEDTQKIEYQAHNLAATDEPKKTPVDKFQKEIERIRRRRKKIQEQMREYERDMRFIAAISGDDSIVEKTAENKWLYDVVQ